VRAWIEEAAKTVEDFHIANIFQLDYLSK